MSAHKSLKNKKFISTKKVSHPGQVKASSRKKSKGKTLNPYHTDPVENAQIMGQKARESASLKVFNSDRVKNLEDNREYR